MEEFSKFKACILCGSLKLKDLSGYQENFLVKCKDCHFVFCGRIPTSAELTSHYEDYPRGKPISPITIKRYNELLSGFDKFRKNNNILDVGCGDGYFLTEAKKRGWNVFGTEFTERAVEVCMEKGIKMSKGALKAATFEQGFFDVITSFEVIEHINNPREESEIMSRLLRTGGLIYVTTPNFNSVSRTLLGHKWNIIGYPEHLCYFTERTLTQLFNSMGFHLHASTSTGISMGRIRRSTSDMGADASRNVDESLRKKTETNLLLHFLKFSINKFLNFIGKGDALKAYYIKV